MILAIIRIYQKTISFDHGLFKFFKPFGQCKFYPSCSEYSYQSIKNRGIVQGGFAGFLRLIRCTPWSAGGIDLPYSPPLTKGAG